NKLLTTSKVGIFGARRVSTRLANKSGRPKTLLTYFSNCWSLLREPSIHSGKAAPRNCRRRASSRSPQHRLYLMPLPQWHASLRPLRGQRPNLLHPFIGNTVVALPASRSEVQRPNGMSFSFGAPTVGSPAASVREGE